MTTFQAFDDRYTAPLHGFRDAADYWEQSSARQFLARIATPALLLNARDDPFLPPTCFPEREARESATFSLEAPAHGGHVGFWDRPGGGWLDQRIVEFLGAMAGTMTQNWYKPRRGAHLNQGRDGSPSRL